MMNATPTKETETMTLTETIREDCGDVDSAKRLRGCLLHATRRLRMLGHNELAKNWRARIARMPKRIEKEAINLILLAACNELDRYGIED